jgi:ribonuclease-3
MAHSVDRQSDEATARVGEQALADYHLDISGTQELTDRLGVDLRPDLLIRALTHRSFAHENPGVPNNERLEFLGDAVLEMVVTRILFERFPTWTEGRLSSIRANTVSQKPLAEVADRQLGLGSYILLGRGEREEHSEKKPTILSDALEALFGAIYLQHGLKVADAVITRLMTPVIETVSHKGPSLDWKTSMTKLAHERGVDFPTYRMEVDADLTHPTFTAHLFMATGPGQEPEEVAAASGTSKKTAQMKAAEKAYRLLTGDTSAK